MNNYDLTVGRDRMQARHVVRLLLVVLILLAAFSTIDPGYAGASIVVNTFDDELNKDGDCSLREAIIAANTDTAVSGCAAGSGADVISVPFGTYSLTVTGMGEDEAALGDLDILESVTINGSVVAATIIDGQGADRVFDIAPLADGTIVINEIMKDPAVVDDINGEWIELFNPTGSAVDINGWTIRDDDTDSHVIINGGPLEVPARGYLVLARESNPLLNGGISAAYEYANFFLANVADEVVLLDVVGLEVDRVDYDDGVTFPDPVGASMALKAPRLENSEGASWCTSSTIFGDGDAGTPGAVNDCLPDPGTGISVQMSSLIIQNGSASNGAGIRNYGDLQLGSVDVTNNTGIGVYHLEGGFEFADGDIDTNTGGGFSSFHSSGPLLDVSFENAMILGNGDAGIECINTTLNVLGGEIQNNGYGGVWGNGCLMDFDSVVIINNTTSGDGGGIMTANYAPTLTNTTVGSNTAEGQGGGIYVWGIVGQELLMTGGSITDNDAENGAGLYLDAGAAMLDGVSVTTNRALDYGGGVFVGVANKAALRLTNGTHIGASGQGNHADFDGNLTGSGGGIYNLGVVWIYDSYVEHNIGAGIDSFSPSGPGPMITLEGSEIASNTGSGISAINTTLTIEDSIIEDNQWGGIWAMGSPLTMTNSSVSENSTTGDGGGLSLLNVTADVITGSTIDGNAAEGEGGGIYFWGLGMDGTLALKNTTISGNTADQHGGGIMVASGAGSILEMSAVTLVNNIADHDDGDDGDGGGIHTTAGAHTKMTHTLIGQNHDLTTGAGIQWGQECVGDIQSYQYNLIKGLSPSVCTIYGGSNDIFGFLMVPIDPLIGPLQGNGGLTDTHALLWGSPTIEAGEPGACSDVNGDPIVTDQRGVPRPIGEACDIGAYEYEYPYALFLPLIMR
jgi:CSLREA domain-containing protein